MTDDVVERAAEASLLVAQVEQMRDQALAQRRLMFLEAVEQGVTGIQLAQATGLSRQRVSKVLDGNSPPRYHRKPA